MLKYAKIINEITKEVQIGVGCSDEYYIEIGMTLMEVEQAYNSLWYVNGYAPKKPEPSIEEMQSNVKRVRNNYLFNTDYTQLGDAPYTEEEKQKYAEYRQYLRDYTKHANWWLEYPKTFNEWNNSNES